MVVQNVQRDKGETGHNPGLDAWEDAADRLPPRGHKVYEDQEGNNQKIRCGFVNIAAHKLREGGVHVWEDASRKTCWPPQKTLILLAMNRS